MCFNRNMVGSNLCCLFSSSSTEANAYKRNMLHSESVNGMPGVWGF